ncbi:MAG: iron chelate uptake ABC transporter family permease subunit, partial [Rhodospirillaceae bacterium]
MALPLMALGWALLFSTWRALDALTLGEDSAASLGFNLASVKIRAILGCAFAVGAAVATTGVISFVGLVVPHVLRPFDGYRPSRLLPVSV